MKALPMTALSVAVAVGTYIGLTVLMPHKKEVAAGEDNAAALARIFGGSLQETPIEPETVSDETTVEPATDETAAEPAGETDAGDTAAEPAETEASEPAADEAAESAPAAVEPEPAPAPAAAPAKPVKPAASSAGSKKNQNPAPTWWGRSAPGNLNLVYAGSAAYKRAIVLMFDGEFKDAAALNRSVKVTNASGKVVNARWEINAKNPRMAVLPVSAAGSYRVSVGAALADAGGRKLGTAQQGPIQIP